MIRPVRVDRLQQNKELVLSERTDSPCGQSGNDPPELRGGQRVGGKVLERGKLGHPVSLEKESEEGGVKWILF